MSVAEGDRPRLDGVDALLCVAMALLTFAALAPLALALARTLTFDYLNLAFDWDPAYFVGGLTEFGAVDGRGINYKHPLGFLFRITAWPFVQAGLAPKASAALAMVLVGSATVAAVYLYGRLVGLGRTGAVAAATFFAATSTTVFTSIVPESYGWANLSLVLLWIAFTGPRGDGVVVRVSRVLAAALVAGVTITNLVQAVIAQLMASGRRGLTRPAVLAAAATGAAALGVVLLLLVLFQPGDVMRMLSSPVQTAKEVYWQHPRGDTVGLWPMLQTYFVFSFLAPEFTRVDLSPAVVMLDFRRAAYSSWQWLAVALWLVFLALNVAAGLRSARARPLVLALLGVVAVNLVFHLGYQYRGSLYIYAAHLHFPIFALGLSAAPLLAGAASAVRRIYVGVLLVLALAALVTSGQRGGEFVGHLGAVVIPANAPEVEP